MRDRGGSGPPRTTELVQEFVALRDSLARARWPGADDDFARTRTELEKIQAHLQRLSRELEDSDFG
jgi:hypothetical protein